MPHERSEGARDGNHDGIRLVRPREHRGGAASCRVARARDMAKAGSVVGNRRAQVPRENIIDAIDGTGVAIADVMWGAALQCRLGPVRTARAVGGEAGGRGEVEAMKNERDG